jgi:hypothetical protein
MDAFDFRDNAAQSTRQRPKGNSGLVWNILTVGVLLVTGCIGLLYLTILLNPNSAFNPFAPPTLPPTFVIPTLTSTSRNELPPTWTLAPTDLPTETSTPRPTNTPLPSPTPIFVIPTDTPTSGPTPSFNFALQPGSPEAIPNIYHPEAGCNWMGVAGQAIALNGGPATGLIVQVGGSLNNQLFETRISLTGAVPQYGQGGYEIPLSDQAIDSSGTLWIQLVDVSNLPFSDKIYFDTYSDCKKNLIIINFRQVK